MDKHYIFGHLLDTFQYVGKLNNAEITIGEDCSVITRYPSPLFNVVMFGAKNQTLTNNLKSSNIPFICLPSKDMEKDFEAFAESENFARADFVTASYKKLKEYNENSHTNFDIRKITTTDELQVFDKISSVAFVHPEGLAFDFLKPIITSSEINMFIAYHDGLPAGCAMTSFVNNQAGLYWNGVLPEFRMKGVGTALVEHRINCAKSLGYKDIISQNMATSLNLYKRLGFEQKGGLPLYICT